MTYTSFKFLTFFLFTLFIYYQIPHRFRWFLLLLASCIFYITFIPSYIFVLLALILVDYFAGLFIEKSRGIKRKRYLILSIGATCLALFIFKYFDFFFINFGPIAKLFHISHIPKSLGLVIPIGLSFHTFQSLSYVIEVYKKRQKAERNFGIYALYVMFFPQLLAGPIERPYNMLHQFYEKHLFKYQEVVNGLRLILWGLFEKVVIADRLAQIANIVYGDPYKQNGPGLIFGTVAFAFQIFCDFDGYTNMARGAAQALGFRLMVNFDRPYFSKSVSEFWRRWHISLSTWLRDYVYIPLGGNRASKPRWYGNILLTFLISGLWHGAGWTFVIWGALHGIYVLMESIFGGIFGNKIKLPRILGWAYTFSVVTFAWIFFRAKDVKEALFISENFFEGTGNFLISLRNINWEQIPFWIASHEKFYGLSGFDYLILILSIFLMLFFHLLQRKGSLREKIAGKPTLVRWAIYYAAVFAILYYGARGQEQFIYFQF